MLISTWWYLPLLAVSLLCYWRVRPELRRHVLTAMSVLIIALVSWRSLAGFLVLAALTYVLGRRLRHADPVVRQGPWLSIAVGANVLYLCTFKFLPAYVPPTAALLATFSDTPGLLPIGISYFTFRFLHYVIEARRRSLPDHDWWSFLSYAALFTIFPAGPIERFTRMHPQLESPAFSAQHVTEGLTRIVIGSVKKIVVADLVLVTLLEGLGRVSSEFDTYSWRSQHAWLLGRLFYLYFDFSGYTDIAVGTSRLFGLRVVENFSRPLFKTNLSEFWRCWHMSLTSWCRDYVYFPVFGLTRNPKLAVYASMLVLGAWHGAKPGWLVWGAWQATGLTVWQLWQAYKRRSPLSLKVSQSRTFAVLSWAVTINWVALGGSWTAFDDLATSFRYIVQIVTFQ